MYSLSWIIENLKDDEFAEAYYAGYIWSVVRGTDGGFRYCDDDGNEVGQELCTLSTSNVRAQYMVHKRR